MGGGDIHGDAQVTPGAGAFRLDGTATDQQPARPIGRLEAVFRLEVTTLGHRGGDRHDQPGAVFLINEFLPAAQIRLG